MLRMTMLAAVCSAILLGHAGGVNSPSDPPQSFPSSQSSVSSSLQTMVAVAEPSRLEITPGMKGRIEEEEWDPLATSPESKTFFQWEPGIIYVAGSGPAGSDLLVSLDLGNNGWLVGNDNIEARVKTDTGGSPSITVRRLNATNLAGPIWEDLPGWSLSSVIRATVMNGRVDYELALTDANLGVLPRKIQKIGARVDLIPSQEPPILANQPRVLSPLILATNRAEGLPSNLHYSIEKLEPAVPSESMNVRFDFSVPKTKGEPQQTVSQPAKKIVISGEGLMQPKLTEVNTPFPFFGTKNKGFVDYNTRVGLDAETGYHILKAVLTLNDDTPATVETSFQVAPIIDVQIQNPKIPAGASPDRSVSVNFSVKSNLRKPVKGSLTFSLDQKFKVLNRSNNEIKFILEPTGRVNKKFEIYLPPNSKGTYPIQFETSVGTLKSTFVRYVTIS